MKPLKERDQATVGVVTILLITALAAGAFYSDRLPLIGSGTTYLAHFSESAGLVPGNEVQVAGVKVGEVGDVSLDGNRVLAEFTVQDTRLGDQTSAAIEIKTLLGEKYISLRPRGKGDLDPDRPIPVNRTTVPFDIPAVFKELDTTTNAIDTQQLADSFRVMSKTFEGTPEHMGSALTGLSELSKSLASRDDELRELLRNSADVSKVVADRNAQVAKLVHDGNLLLGELQARREAIHGLLVGTQQVSDQLRGLVADNQHQLAPALDELNRVTEMLQRNQDNISRTIEAMAPYVRIFNNTIGTGRWFDGYLCGILPPQGGGGGPVQINPEGCEVPGAKGGR